MAQHSNEESTAGQTGFFDLPPELREQIYRYVLPDTVDLSFPTRVRGYRRFRMVSLLLVCRTIHVEAAPLYYRESIFLCKWFSGIKIFLHALGAAKRVWLKNLHLAPSPYESMMYDNEKKAKTIWAHNLTLQSYGLGLRPGVLKTMFLVDGKEIWAAEKPDGSK